MRAGSPITRLFVAICIIWTNICLLIVAANVVAVMVLSFSRSVHVPPHVRQRLKAVFPDLSDRQIRDLVAESKRGFTEDFLVQHREKPGVGEYVNVSEHGFRLSLNQGPWPPESRYYNVFLFGGSTTFGYGVPDQYTIASYIQQLMPPVDGREVRVYNFGRGAYYSTQEWIAFARLLVIGREPDLAIFIDGLNDFFHYFEPPTLTMALTEKFQTRDDRPIITALLGLPIVRLASRAMGGPMTPEALVVGSSVARQRKAVGGGGEIVNIDRVIERYVANKRIVDALGAAYHIEVASVWQPVPTYHYDLSRHPAPGDFGGHAHSGPGYQRMAEFVSEHAMGRNFLWCADLHEGTDDRLYVDKVHYSPVMSERVAQCIVDLLVKRDLLR